MSAARKKQVGSKSPKSAKQQKVNAKVIALKAARKKARPLTHDEVDNLILDYRANARKLSRSILRRWHARMDLEELDSLVDLALCEAARRYDPRKGASFMTFLFYHLRGCLVRAVDAAANVNMIPAAAYEVSELSSDYNGDGNQSGSASDIAEALCNRDYMLPDEMLYKKELANLSNAACGKLDALEQEVIYRIYALEEPLIDIARTLGYSRCHISRVKKRALEVLHGTLSDAVGGAEIGKGPIFDDQDDEDSRRPVTRRKLAKRNINPKFRSGGQEIFSQPQEAVVLDS